MNTNNFLPALRISRHKLCRWMPILWRVTPGFNVIALLVVALLPAGVIAQSNELLDIGYSSLSADRVLVKLTLSQPVKEPLSFTIDNPARIALDFSGVKNKLKRKSVIKYLKAFVKQ